MENLRGLSTSLPHARRRIDAPELLVDFKAAALSVTNLYKSAAASQTRARDAGYQDALDDLLALLDRENLGLMDGEGWRVRQWATERLVDDGRLPERQNPRQASDEEADDEIQGQRRQRQESRSSSPEMQRKMPPTRSSSSEVGDNTADRRTAASEPPQAQPPTSNVFTFRSSHADPTNHDREAHMDVDGATTLRASTPASTIEATPHSVRLVPRPHGRGRNHHSRRGNNSATTAPTFNLGAAAGSKRKLPYQDFFDISGLSFDRSPDGKDGGGGRGGKRGRHV